MDALHLHYISVRLQRLVELLVVLNDLLRGRAVLVHLTIPQVVVKRFLTYAVHHQVTVIL